MNISAASTSTPIILVVEDEPILRMFAVDMVEDAGFLALEAGDATEATGILEQRGDIRLVFTDVEMPRGLDGIRFAALIRLRWPPIRIVITSGKALPADAQLPPDSTFFSKPYRQDRVVAEFRRMLA